MSNCPSANGTFLSSTFPNTCSLSANERPNVQVLKMKYLMTTDKKEDPIEILVIDSDRISVALTHIFFDKVLDNHKWVVDFDSAQGGLKYLSDTKDKTPKIILLETFMPDGKDFSFLEKYASLERTDFVYVVSISNINSDISKCLSHKFVRKYITKPITLEHATNIAKELKRELKKKDGNGGGV